MFTFTIWRQQVSSKKRDIFRIFFLRIVTLHAIYRVSFSDSCSSLISINTTTRSNSNQATANANQQSRSLPSQQEAIVLHQHERRRHTNRFDVSATALLLATETTRRTRPKNCPICLIFLLVRRFVCNHMSHTIEVLLKPLS